MYRLQTFGGLALERDGEPMDPIAAHRKALALLAMLAVHGAMGRERIMLLLWPESDQEHAKGSLKQSVHLLRRQLAEPGLILGTAELRLNPACIGSDVQDFQQALIEGDPEVAVGLYSGPFLDGVHVSGAPNLERWVDERRTDLASRYHEALEALARQAEVRGDFLAAVKWWRRLQGSDPFNSRVALCLMRAFENVGDPASALRHARIHELLVREELGIPPDPAVLALAKRLQTSGSLERDAGPPIAGASAPTSSPDPAPAMSAPHDGDGDPSPANQARHPPRRSLLIGLGAAGIVGIGLSATWGATSMDRRASASDSLELPPIVSPHSAQVALAVLPFADMSAEGDQEYFSDGITEEILNALAQNPGLRVPARSSSFYFKGKNLPVKEIASALDVDAILEGSVRKSGDRVRITVQLIDAREDRHLWSETFDRDLEDILAVQSEIAAVVAESLRVQLSASEGEAVRSPERAAAHDAYLRGLFHWNRRSGPDLQLAIRFFDEAIRIDPGHARAYAGLALVHAVIPISFTPAVPADEARRRVVDAAERALALDPGLAEPHAALGLSYHFQWRWDDAEQSFRRALALNPGYPTAHQWYGEHLAKTGRGAEGEAALRRAIELDPLSLVAHNDLGLVLMLNRRFPEAILQWERTLEMDPTFAHPLYFLHRIHLLEGRVEASADAGRRWAELTTTASPGEIVTLAHATRDPALVLAATEILDRWEGAAVPRWLDIAFYQVLLGEHDAALRSLEHGVRARAPMMAQIGASPWLDPLRGDDRMERLLLEVGLQ